MRIVLDSDVVVSALISSKGAGHFILKNILGKKQVQITTCDKQIKEIEKVLKKPQFIWQPNLKLWQKFQDKTNKVILPKKHLNLCLKFTKDPDDKHILASALIAKTSFLLTYNLKDYKREKIKDVFDVLVVNPGYFIQFWREKIKNKKLFAGNYF